MDDKVDLLAEMEAEENANGSEKVEPTSNQTSAIKFKLGILGDRDKTVNIRTLFTDPNVECRSFEDVDSLVAWGPNVSFVCQEITLLQNDTLDDSPVIDAVVKILNTTKSGICLKSDISPETVTRLFTSVSDEETLTKRFVYHPELENNATIEETLNPKLICLGGSKEATDALMSVYISMSNLIVSREKVVNSSVMDVAFFKLAYNGYKAVAQTFFNQLYDVVNEYAGSNYNLIRSMFIESQLTKDFDLFTVPTFTRCKESENLSYKRARAYKGEYLNRDVRLFSALSDKLPLMDECINYRNLKDV